MVKMTDVAELAGVSIKTVSRVINNEPHVKESLRIRVREAAVKLGYVPSATARSLRSNRSYIIHLISHSIDSSYVYKVQAGAMKTCQESGYQLMVSVIDDDEDDLLARFHEHFRKESSHRAIETAILVPPFSDRIEITDLLTSYGVRVARVGANEFDDGVINVMIDERLAARQLTERLIESGHRKIGFVRGKENQNATHERFEGFRTVLNENRLSMNTDHVVPGKFTFDSGLAAGTHLLSLKDRPTAIFASNDDMAAGIIVAGYRLGLTAPKDFSVVGFDDSDIASRTWPALTTVRQPMFDFGAVVTSRIIDSYGHEDSDISSRSILSHELILRDSVGPPPG